MSEAEIAREGTVLRTDTDGAVSLRHHERNGEQRTRGRKDRADQHCGRSVHEAARRMSTVSKTRPAGVGTRRLSAEAILKPDDIHTPIRQAMRELRDMRQGRREGIWPMPMQTVLVQEYIIQKKADRALRGMVELETAALDTLESLLKEANIELPKCQAALNHARTKHERVHRDRVLARHLHMLEDLEEQRSARATSIHALTREFNSNEEHPVEQHVRRYDKSPMPES